MGTITEEQEKKLVEGDFDVEVLAMQKLVWLMTPLDEQTRRRVLDWAIRRFVSLGRI